MTLYDALDRLLKILNLDIADVEYTDVYEYPDHVNISVTELLELSKKVSVDIMADDAVYFDIYFNTGHVISWKPDDECYEMTLKFSLARPRPKEGHVSSLIMSET